jgi:ATP-binding cassette subfamily C protein CydC
MATRRLPALQQDLAQAHAALAADYAEMAGPAVDIAVYGLAPAMTAALAERAAAQAAAQAALARAEAAITAVQALLAALTLAAMALLAQGPAPLLALALLAAMAALEPWAGLAAHDSRAPDVRLAAERVAQAGETQAQPAVPVALLATVPTLTIAEQLSPRRSAAARWTFGRGQDPAARNARRPAQRCAPGSGRGRA